MWRRRRTTTPEGRSPQQQFSLGSLILLMTVTAVVLAMIRSAVISQSLSEGQAAAAVAGTLVGAVVGAAMLSGELRSVLLGLGIGALVGGLIGFLAATRVDLGVTLVGNAAIIVVAWLVRPRPQRSIPSNRSPWSE